MKEINFYIPEELMLNDRVIVKSTGVEYKLTPDLKILYAYMRRMFLKAHYEGKPYHENWKSLGLAIGKDANIFKKKVDRYIPINKVLESIGLLVILKEKTKRTPHKLVLSLEDVKDNLIFFNSIKDGQQYTVYKLHHNDNLVYIGQSTSLRDRLSQHRSDKVFDRVTYCVCDSFEEMDTLEKLLIQRLTPCLNKSILNPDVKLKVSPNLIGKTFIEYL